MNIEWWMVDGLLGLIILAAAIRGAAKGIGDTFLRIAGFAGGIVLGVLYSDRVAAYLTGTRLDSILHRHIFNIIRGTVGTEPRVVGEEPSDVVSGMLNSSVTGPGEDPYIGSLPRALGSAVSNLADKAADAAADRLTAIAISVIGFVLILLAIWIVMSILRAIYRHFRRNSVIIGFLDRVLGFVMGVIRGLLLACVAMALIIPAATLISPARVPELINAIHEARFASIIYDINPVLFVIKHFLL